jgi:hypothetical protein
VTPTKTVRPSPSFVMQVPQLVREEVDGRVSSYWVDGEPLLLQVSSSLRVDGEQVDARARLRSRIDTAPASWTVRSDGVHPDPSLDQASAECVDGNGVLWVHAYLVWPHLTVYALVSGPEALLRATDNWAVQAVASIKLVLH